MRDCPDCTTERACERCSRAALRHFGWLDPIGYTHNGSPIRDVNKLPGFYCLRDAEAGRADDLDAPIEAAIDATRPMTGFSWNLYGPHAPDFAFWEANDLALRAQGYSGGPRFVAFLSVGGRVFYLSTSLGVEERCSGSIAGHGHGDPNALVRQALGSV